MEVMEEVLDSLAGRFVQAGRRVWNVRTGMEAREAAEHPMVEELRGSLVKEFGSSSLSGVYQPNFPVRGPYGEAEIWLKPDAKPVSLPSYRIMEKRMRALQGLVENARETGKLEEGRGPVKRPLFRCQRRRPGLSGWSRTSGLKTRRPSRRTISFTR